MQFKVDNEILQICDQIVNWVKAFGLKIQNLV